MGSALIKGQGATEYLVLLGVVLLIGLIVIALLGFFPGTATGVTESESKAYWTGVASPIRVLEVSYQDAIALCGSSPNSYSFVVENVGQDDLSITGVKVEGSSLTLCTDPLSLAAGERKKLDVENAPTLSCSGNTRQGQVGLVFTYRSRYITGQTQNGTKKLVVNC